MDINKLHHSALIEPATEAKRPTRWWLACLFIVFIGIVGGQLIVYIGMGSLFQPAQGSIGAQISEIATNGTGLLLLWAWLHFKEGRSFSSLGFRGTDALRRFLTGVGIGAGMLTLSVLLMYILGQYQTVPAPTGAISGLATLLPVILLVVVWVVQSSTEELFMRGYLVQTSALQLPGWLAILIPGLIFSALHFTQGGLSEPVAVINILLFSFFASFISLRQGSLWLVCGIHTGWNWFQGNVFGVPVSGNAYSTGLFHFGPTETASYLLGGGTFGPENSLIVSIVWGIATFIAYRYFCSARVPKVVVQPA